MDQMIKANLNVNVLQSCNELKEYETEQKISTQEEVRVEPKQKMHVEEKVCVERQQQMCVDYSINEEVHVKRDQKIMRYFEKIDNNMTHFFSK